MKQTRFRSIEEWKSALMTLPDTAYFDLMRTIFGNIKTPFNKQRLMEDLFVLLSREEIRKIIAAYIDRTDHKVIAAIALLDEPVPGDLEVFFAGELSRTELHGALLNLEERFILYRFREEGVYRLAFNPVLETVLAPFIADKSSLFPSLPLASPGGGEESPSDYRGFILDDRILAAAFAFIPEEDEFFKSEGGIRKKILDTGELIFPGRLLPLLAGGLQRLGLLQAEGEGLRIHDQRIGEFSKLSRRERMEYCASGMYLHLSGPEPETGTSVLFHRGRIKALTRFIHRFLDFLDSRRQYPLVTLKRFAGISVKEEPSVSLGGNPEPGGGISQNGAGAFREGFQDSGGLNFDILIDVLEKTRLLESIPSGFRKTGAALSGDEGRTEQPALAMDATFSCVLYPGISFTDALSLAAFCSVRETGAAVRFELTRKSVVRGFDRGIDAAAMIALLNRLSGSRIDQNLVWTLGDWESRYAAVSLHQGVVLTLAEDRRYLAEAEPLASLVERTLAPGVYLLAVQEKTEAAGALKKAGVDIISQPPPDLSAYKAGAAGFYSPLESAPLPETGSSASPKAEDGDGPEVRSGDTARLETIKEKFRLVLGKMRLSKPDRDELAARIERRLILSEVQLEGASVRYEKLEARGLDYVGKSTIAKQAIASKSLVEVFWPHPGGGTNQVLGIPEALEKREGESVLLLKPLSQEDPIPAAASGNIPQAVPEYNRGNVISPDLIRLPLGKISLLRRIKQSIFGE
jgi:hypothetical protein